jgi:alkylation response protein AidB-like acyl-CoA dehydrogenase
MSFTPDGDAGMSPARFPEYSDFRQEVRAFIEQNLTDEMIEAGRLQTSVFPHMKQAIAWQKILHQRGWAAPSWPREFGGPGWNAIQQQIFREEAYRASAPTIVLQGLTMCGPCLMGYGTQAQQDYYLPRILSAEHIWCQGYSEPGAGSDLASLTTSAVRDGEHYVLNGAKVWTSHAHVATHMFCLVRTSTEGKPQAGITFLLVDMSTPGITVEPIINLNGIHEQNTVFLEDVRVPQANRVGEENDGWPVAKYLLEFERGSVCISPELRRNLDFARRGAAQEKTSSGERLIDDRVFRRKLAAKDIELSILEFNERRILSIVASGGSPGVLSSVAKIEGMELLQGIDKLTTEVAGPYSLPLQRGALVPGHGEEPIGPDYALTAMPRYLDGRSVTIAGGTSEVQRGILAKSVLGL